MNTLVDGSIDNPGSRAGKRAKSRAGSMYLDWAESKTELYYHSGDMSQLPYDFFAYYIDDMKVSETDYKRSELASLIVSLRDLHIINIVCKEVIWKLTHISRVIIKFSL